MIIEDNIKAIIVATSTDRCGTDLVFRGCLPFFGRPIIEITFDILHDLKLNKIFVYTTRKGIAIKNILGRKVQYILKKHDYVNTDNQFSFDLSGEINNCKSILLIDPMYPFLDTSVIKNLIDYHFIANNDVTFLKATYKEHDFIPNIILIKTCKFYQVINHITCFNKVCSLQKLIEFFDNDKINYGFFTIKDVVKVLSLNNNDLIDDIESIMLNRK